MSNGDANFMFFVGLVIISGCVGVEYGALIGWSVLGAGVMVRALIAGLLNYLTISRSE